MIQFVYKELGETPREALERCRREHKINPDTSMTYAGRLDPMAEGWMYVLSGADVHHKIEYSNRDKTYELTILWGVTSDTYDLLGMPQFVCGDVPDTEHLRAELSRWVTTYRQPYPPFSSKPVVGKPLWQWSREGRLHEIVVPTKIVRIYDITHKEHRSITAQELRQTVRYRCSLPTQDFRQDAIIAAWTNEVTPQAAWFGISVIQVRCSAGTYMRSLAAIIGSALGVGGCAYAIKRTHIGGS